MTEKFDLKPAEQCTKTETGHFGELMKDVYQGKSGAVARETTWTPDQQADAQHYVQNNARIFGDNSNAGPKDLKQTEMVFDNKIYTFGEDKKDLSVDGKVVPKNSAEYHKAVTKIEAAKHHLDFTAPICPGAPSAFWQSLETPVQNKK